MARSRIRNQQSGGLRRRVAHLIDTVTFDPPGMPPSSILLVRRLTDPLPRGLLSHTEAMRPTPEWERAVQNRLREYHRKAAHPAQGPVSANADAILFADHAEMLACLACDLWNGNAASLWWWRAILRTLPPGALETLVAAWHRDVRYVPAAISLLSARRQAVGILSALSPTQAWSIFEAITREFEVHLPIAGGAASFGSALRSQEFAGDRIDSARPGAASTAAPEAIGVFLAACVPHISPELVPGSLGRERAALLGVSLLLHRAPEVVRTARFAQAFARWYESAPLAAQGSRAVLEPETPRPRMPDKAVSMSGTADAVEHKEHEAGAALTSPHTAHGDIPAAELTVPATLERRATPTRGRHELLSEDVPLTASPAARPSSDRAQPPSAETKEEPAVRIVIELPQAESFPMQQEVRPGLPASAEVVHEQAGEADLPSVKPLAAFSPEESYQTELGGVLFLINLLRALKLPASLETEFGIERIDGWEMVELFARVLLGRRHQSLLHDAIWSVLASLAARASEVPPADGFRGQNRYRIPASWLASAGCEKSSQIGLRVRGGQLQFWHAEGFVLADYIYDVSPSRRLIEAEAQQFFRTGEQTIWSSWRNLNRHIDTGCHPLGTPLRGELHRFLAFLLPFLRWRLAVALRVQRIQHLPEALLLRRGRLYVTSTHVDLVMNLNQATVPVRMAGLDADPGWVPDLRRVVKFSFVQEAFL